MPQTCLLHFTFVAKSLILHCTLTIVNLNTVLKEIISPKNIFFKLQSDPKINVFEKYHISGEVRSRLMIL